MTFDDAFDRLLGHEGGYSFNANDPGGETMWGVTARVAYANGYRGDMKVFPRDSAKAIYRKSYWDACRCDELPADVRFHLFDAAVNSGDHQAVLWLQRAAGVDADGAIGPATLAAVAAAVPDRLIRHIEGERLEFMTDLPTWAGFGRGWARRIADNLKA